MPRTSSGSSASERAVNPTRSTNTTVTTRRSSRGASATSGLAQARQKRAMSGFSCAQAGQISTDRRLDRKQAQTKHAPCGARLPGDVDRAELQTLQEPLKARY